MQQTFLLFQYADKEQTMNLTHIATRSGRLSSFLREEMAINEPAAFAAVVEKAKAAL